VLLWGVLADAVFNICFLLLSLTVFSR